jgi:hypothetical protein
MGGGGRSYGRDPGGERWLVRRVRGAADPRLLVRAHRVEHGGVGWASEAGHGTVGWGGVNLGESGAAPAGWGGVDGGAELAGAGVPGGGNGALLRRLCGTGSGGGYGG